MNLHHSQITWNCIHCLYQELLLHIVHYLLPPGRYMQFCEDKRPDVTLIEQELMSYDWYIPKMAHLFKSVNFPGDRWHNIVGKTLDGLHTFNMLNFLDANIDNRYIL